MIDVVGAKAGTHQLLEEICLLVRALGGAEPGERARTMSVADMLQSGGGALQRLFPGGQTEMGPWIAGIDGIVDVLSHAVPADHRLGEPLWIVDVVEPEPAFHA